MPTEATVTNDPTSRRYVAVVDSSQAGFVDYQETDELVVLTHTDVDPAFEGRGVGSALARYALEDVRARGLKALVICPFILRWLRKHPDYVDVLYNAPKPRVGDQEHQG